MYHLYAPLYEVRKRTMKLPHFKILKAAQVAAYFALKEGGKINVLKLTKLIYLADRNHLEKYDTPILFDRFVSMPHGPVNSITYDYLSGCSYSAQWDEFVSDRSGHDVSATEGVTFASLDQLSKAEIKILDAVWEQFKGQTGYQVRDYTHKFCPEWIDPNGSSNPIQYETIFKWLKKENSTMLAEAVEDERQLQRAWL